MPFPKKYPVRPIDTGFPRTPITVRDVEVKQEDAWHITFTGTVVASWGGPNITKFKATASHNFGNSRWALGEVTHVGGESFGVFLRHILQDLLQGWPGAFQPPPPTPEEQAVITEAVREMTRQRFRS